MTDHRLVSVAHYARGRGATVNAWQKIGAVSHATTEGRSLGGFAVTRTGLLFVLAHCPLGYPWFTPRTTGQLKAAKMLWFATIAVRRAADLVFADQASVC